MGKKLYVITGGASGIGLETARILGKDHELLLAGRRIERLEGALASLRRDGIEARIIACDVADRDSVQSLAARAKELGDIASVINSAGISAGMSDARTIMMVNAIGTMNVNEAFYEVMGEGSCVIDVASMAGHIVPKIVLPTRSYKLSRVDRDLFLKRMMARVNIFPERYRADMAYSISKHFVIWYAKTDAARFGAKGIRVISVSPGLFETPMADAERGKAAKFAKHSAFKRYGDPAEIAHLIAFCAGDKPGYLTGTDILCDGGLMASGYNPLRDR